MWLRAGENLEELPALRLLLFGDGEATAELAWPNLRIPRCPVLCDWRQTEFQSWARFSVQGVRVDVFENVVGSLAGDCGSVVCMYHKRMSVMDRRFHPRLEVTIEPLDWIPVHKTDNKRLLIQHPSGLWLMSHVSCK